MPKPEKREWLGGEVVKAEVKPETLKMETTKMMKVVSITRTPTGRVASLQMRLKAGLVQIEIDEATARAIAKVFD